MSREAKSQNTVADLDLRVHGEAVRFAVRVKPRSSRSRIEGLSGGGVDVALRAPPVEGAANEELVGLLAKVVRVRKSDVAVAAGAQSRNKLVEIRGAPLEVVRERLLLSASRGLPP
jgi:uncharacterized protein (TIGR00251 family)